MYTSAAYRVEYSLPSCSGGKNKNERKRERKLNKPEASHAIRFVLFRSLFPSCPWSSSCNTALKGANNVPKIYFSSGVKSCDIRLVLSVLFLFLSWLSMLTWYGVFCLQSQHTKKLAKTKVAKEPTFIALIRSND